MTLRQNNKKKEREKDSKSIFKMITKVCILKKASEREGNEGNRISNIVETI
jgi:hypothetical protein